MESSTPKVELIQAKTRVPMTRQGVIARTELLVHLAGAAGKPLVVASAPAGYGKTTVLSQWAQTDTARRFAWVSLDSTENDPVVFWRYVLSSIRSHHPELAAVAWGSLAGPAPQLEDIVLPNLLNSLVSLQPGLVVVLDDYHRVTSARVNETVKLFVDYLPRSTQLVISSRSTPPLDLARFRARGLVEEISRADLAFDVNETGRVLTGQRDEVAEGEVAEIHRRTEGWAAGVYLAAVTHRPHRWRQAKEIGPSDVIRDYLIQELLGTLPDEDRNFLLETSILDRMSGELCDFVTGGTHSAQRLAAAAKRNLFLIPLDEEGEWYRYHHMFQEVLLAELGGTRPDDVAALHLRAHDWLVKYGFVSEAIDQAHAAGNVAAAAELVCSHAFEYIVTGRLATAHQWLSRFGDEDCQAYPPLLVASAWAACFRGDGWAARRFARLAADASYDGPSPDGMSSFEASVSLLVASIAPDGVTKAHTYALRARDAEPLESSWRPLVEAVVGVTSMAVGDVEAAEDALVQAAQLAADSDAVITYALAQRAFVATLQGRWDEAERYSNRTVTLIEEIGIQDLASTCYAYAIAASIALNNNRVVEAKRYVRMASSLEQGLSDALPFEALQAHLLLAEVHLAVEDYVAAGIHSRAASTRLQTLGDAGILEPRLDALLAALGAQDLEEPAPEPKSDSLTTRELQVLQLLPSGKSLREIADELYVSRNTAKTHASRIYKKLGVSSREEAVTRAIEMHLI